VALEAATDVERVRATQLARLAAGHASGGGPAATPEQPSADAQRQCRPNPGASDSAAAAAAATSYPRLCDHDWVVEGCGPTDALCGLGFTSPDATAPATAPAVASSKRREAATVPPVATTSPREPCLSAQHDQAQIATAAAGHMAAAQQQPEQQSAQAAAPRRPRAEGHGLRVCIPNESIREVAMHVHEGTDDAAEMIQGLAASMADRAVRRVQQERQQQMQMQMQQQMQQQMQMQQQQQMQMQMQMGSQVLAAADDLKTAASPQVVVTPVSGMRGNCRYEHHTSSS
jgi:hypothetical protein